MTSLSGGDAFGDYTIEGLIATGGMGAVYAARNRVYGTAVALKVLHERFHRDPDWQRRFNHEGVVGERLKHPHILSARELVVHDDRVALVLDLVRGGQTLGKVVARDWPQGLPPDAGLLVFRAVVEGVEYLHGKGVVHGDLKPANILLEGPLREPARWTPRVTDFGTVGLIADPVVIDGQIAVVATPQYATPEHMWGVDRIEPRSDIFALGLLLHFLLTGRHASPARSTQEALTVLEKPLSLTGMVDQRQEVRDLAVRCLALDPADRPQTCRELALEVRTLLDALGVRLEVEDLDAELATEVDEDRAAWRRQKGRPDAVPQLSPPTAYDPDDPEFERTEPTGTTPLWPAEPEDWDTTVRPSHLPPAVPAEPASGGVPLWVWMASGVALCVLAATAMFSVFSVISAF
ncbi:MAG: serine/threonine protein kinase [Myxococcota bacterium]|jgi:serine/threonine protein kinase